MEAVEDLAETGVSGLGRSLWKYLIMALFFSHVQGTVNQIFISPGGM